MMITMDSINPQLKCIRCQYEWWRRQIELPKFCPRCNSPYWNKPYTRGKPKDQETVVIQP